MNDDGEKMKERRLLIISYGKYPDGNAGAVRQHAFAKLYQACGYDIVVIGMGDSTEFSIKEYDGIKYISFRKNPNHTFNKILNWFLYGRRLRKFIKTCDMEFTDILVIKTYFSFVLAWIKRFSKRKGIRLYHDSVEWYSPEEFKLKKYDIAYIKNNRLNTKEIDENFKVIAISKYLFEHYHSRGIDTIRIPVIMDSKSITYEKNIQLDKLVISYAGRIGKKDYIGNIIRGFFLLTEDEKEKIEFRVMGANATEISQITGISRDELERNRNTVICMGRISRAEVLKNLQETDFTVLIRDSSLRYAKAGFPTKVVESLMSGTPVICNLSSDLGEYLIDGENAVIVRDMKPESIVEALRLAINIPIEKRKEMHLKARKTAEEFFDYRKYIDIFKDWSD